METNVPCTCARARPHTHTQRGGERDIYSELRESNFVDINKLHHQIIQVRKGTIQHHSSNRRVFSPIKKATSYQSKLRSQLVITQESHIQVAHYYIAWNR